MNISELARRLRISPKELQVLLPKLGFDIGVRAVKIADQAAYKLIREWPALIRKIEKEQADTEVKNERVAAEVQTPKEIAISERITVRQLSSILHIPVAKLLQSLIKEGILANVNETLDFDTASIVAEDFGVKVVHDKNKAELEIETLSSLSPASAASGALMPRPPVVVVMGHVDHGKTKLLDAIRKTNVMEGEAGGITQHIGAYQTLKNGRTITFLDTPGHEAFVSMRSRGARIADLAILVVAADDGIQPQTLEALRIIQAAKLPFVVAINKIDKTGAEPERVKRQLAELQFVPEEWGGKTICLPISAKQGLGIENLLETLLILSDLDEGRLMADEKRPAVATVIESRRDPGEGIVATLLVQAGLLRRGDVLAVGNVFFGKVKAMKDFQGKDLTVAKPAQPVRVLGFKLLPEVGMVVEVKEERLLVRQKEKARGVLQPAAIEEEKIEKPALLLAVKADGAGSLEALSHELEKLKQEEVEVKIVNQGFGNVRESDVLKAKAQEAHIIGFQVEVEPDAQRAISETGVPIFTSKIIYEVIEEVKKKIEKLLPPLVREVLLGKITVVKVFRKDGNNMIIGGRVHEGTIEGGQKVHLIRRGKKIVDGEIQEVRQGGEVLKTAISGQEIGLKIKVPCPAADNDMLEAYREEKEARKLGE
jgi:translation initiation factor IF-2